MRNLVLIILVGLLVALPVFPQQEQAKEVLDKTASAFRKAGGVKAEFEVKALMKGKTTGETTGTIQLKGEKFILKTPDVVTWFDGKTQWSYLSGSDEVNVSTPTPEELQSINPYAMLSIYQSGFSYVFGKTTVFRGKSIYEVILTSTDKTQDIVHLTLCIAKDSYQPLYIVVELRDGSRSQIAITNFRSDMTYADSLFVFDKKQYPHAEVIDLR